MKGSNRCDKPRPPMPELVPGSGVGACVVYWHRTPRGLFVWVAPVVWWSRALVSRCV